MFIVRHVYTSSRDSVSPVVCHTDDACQYR